MLKILGIGSPFGDDQLGWEMVKLLKQYPKLQNLSIESYDRPGIRLLELMKNTQTILLIDAIVTGQPVGTLHRFQNEEIDELPKALSTHEVGLALTLKLGRALNNLPDNIVLYGIEIDTSYATGTISSAVQGAMPQLATRIEDEIIILLQKNT